MVPFGIRKFRVKNRTEPNFSITICPDPGSRFGVGVLESGVGWDRASASGSLRRLNFRIQYLVMGGGRIAGHNDEVVDLNRGDAHEQESRCGGG